MNSSIGDVLTFLHDQKAAQEAVDSSSAAAATTTIKPPVFHTGIAGLIKNYIWTNKYQTTTPASEVVPEQT